MKYFKPLLLLVIVSIIASFSYAQVSGTGSIVVLVASTPAPTATATPVAGCPSGDTCATPISEFGTLYGAGGGTYPTLRAGYATWSCTTGTTDNSSSLQTAINNASTAGLDLQLQGSGQCTVLGTVTFKSNMAVQCQNIGLQLYTPQTGAGGPTQFSFTGVSNMSLSNCTVMGANTIDPSFYPGCSGSPPNQTSCPAAETVLLGHAPASAITIINNQFLQTVGQASIEFENGGSSNGTSPVTAIHIDWNTFENGAPYVFDDVTNSDESHNWSHNSSIDNELDDSAQTLNGVTVIDNYMERDYYGVGAFGAFNNTNAFASTYMCGQTDSGSPNLNCTQNGTSIGALQCSVGGNNEINASTGNGCLAQGNVVNGGASPQNNTKGLNGLPTTDKCTASFGGMTGCMVSMGNATGSGGAAALNNPGGHYVPISGTNSPNFCINGCGCGFAGNGTQYDNAGCVNTVP